MTDTTWVKVLMDWSAQLERELPWREKSPRDPYRVWISEIMLQQTRTEAVKPYFNTWMEKFPTVHALAEASEAEVMPGRDWAITAGHEIFMRRPGRWTAIMEAGFRMN
jgi:A/G-specific adenine glycosylase